MKKKRTCGARSANCPVCAALCAKRVKETCKLSCLRDFQQCSSEGSVQTRQFALRLPDFAALTGRRLEDPSPVLKGVAGFSIITDTFAGKLACVRRAES